MTGLSGTTWTIRSGDDEATVVEVGAGLQSYRRGGVDVTCRYGDDELPPKGCGITLVPWPNRIRDGHYTFDGVAQQLALTEPDKRNAIHGLGRWARWDLVEHGEDHVTLGLDVVPQKGYPFQVHAEVHYRVGVGGLVVELSGRNDGRTRAPFGMGSHPYLSTRGQALDDLVLSIPVESTFEVDEQQIPIGKRPLRAEEEVRGDRLGERRFDQGFTDVVFEQEHYEPNRRPDEIYQMFQVHGDGFSSAIWFDGAFRYVQGYTVDEVTPGQPGIAFEPMTCAPDAFNSGDGLIVLEPGERWSGRWGVTPG